MKKKLQRGIAVVLFTAVLMGCTARQQSEEPRQEVPGQQTTEFESQEPPVRNLLPRTIENKYGVFYEIFVRSFADSTGDGIGDLKGLTEKLDYVNDGDENTVIDLGVDGIWLMPINPSPSYHKYDVTDYYNIDPEYGTLEDFQSFLEEAHKRGIRVIMDLVVNHTSSRHPWFLEAIKNPDSEYRDYYHWVKEGEEGINLKAQVWGHRVWNKRGDSYYFALFWDQMPDLNLENPKVREEIKEIARFWLQQGVDGFRLDAAKHVYDIHEYPKGTNVRDKNILWWEEFRAACEEVNPDVYLIGEVWDIPSTVAPFFRGLDSNFNFEVAEKGIITMVNNGVDLQAKPNQFVKNLEKIYAAYAKEEPNFLDAPFLANHDQERTMTQLKGDLAKAKLAADILLTLPGNPFIYYGEEIGMLGAKPDERIREPFIWFTEQKLPQTSWEPISHSREVTPLEVQDKDENSLYNHYKQMIRVRKSSNALVKGSFQAFDTNNNKIIGFIRSYAEERGETLLVLHNLSGETQMIDIVGWEDAQVFYQSSGRTKRNGAQALLASQSTLILQR